MCFSLGGRGLALGKSLGLRDSVLSHFLVKTERSILHCPRGVPKKEADLFFFFLMKLKGFAFLFSPFKYLCFPILLA